MVLRIIAFGVVTALLLLAVYAVVRRSRTGADAEALFHNASSDELLPSHYRYFPQVRRALTMEDLAYVTERAGPGAARAMRKARRQIGLEFLLALREDYGKLNRLAKAVTALAPSASTQRETERLWLELQFGFLWSLVWLSVWSGFSPLGRLRQLSESIGAFAARMESALGIWQQGRAPLR